MIARDTAEFVNDTAKTTPIVITEKERLWESRPTTKIWIDTKHGADYDTGTGKALTIQSIKTTAAGLEQWVQAYDISHTPFVIDTTDGRKGTLMGYDAASGGAASINHSAMIGNADMLFPVPISAGFYVAVSGKFELPASSVSMFFAIDAEAPDLRLGMAFGSAGQFRFYYDYPSLALNSANSLNDGSTPAFWEAVYDGTTLKLYRNTVQVASLAVAIAALTTRTIRLGSARISSAPVTGTLITRGYFERFFIANTFDLVGDIAAARALIKEDHPSWLP